MTGASTTPIRVPDVLDNRLAPNGTLTRPEKKRSEKCDSAQAGQAMNHTSCAGSPQAHVNDAEGCPVHTCHHKTTPGTVKMAIHTRCRRMPSSTPFNRRISRGRADGCDWLITGASVPPGLRPQRDTAAFLQSPLCPPAAERLHRTTSASLSVVVCSDWPRPGRCSRRGREVLLLDSNVPGHPGSGSKGSARIFRLSYPDTQYIEHGRGGASICGTCSRRTAAASCCNHMELLNFGQGLSELTSAMDAVGAPYALLSNGEVRERFPAMDIPGPGLSETTGGILLADECLQALIDTASFAVRWDCEWRTLSTNRRVQWCISLTATRCRPVWWSTAPDSIPCRCSSTAGAHRSCAIAAASGVPRAP